MKASELSKTLADLVKEHGDLKVFVPDTGREGLGEPEELTSISYQSFIYLPQYDSQASGFLIDVN